ncbi:DNA-binding transcriptional LysR family regulator [Variovorax sp. SG517]|nr:DNA-binding transcriptional LysR family regulator [Variovorax sp. SG517]
MQANVFVFLVPYLEVEPRRARSCVPPPCLRPLLPDFVARYSAIRLDLCVSDPRVDLIGANVDCVICVGPPVSCPPDT